MNTPYQSPKPKAAAADATGVDPIKLSDFNGFVATAVQSFTEAANLTAQAQLARITKADYEAAVNAAVADGQAAVTALIALLDTVTPVEAGVLSPEFDTYRRTMRDTSKPFPPGAVAA